MDGLGKESRLMRVQYLNLTIQRVRRHEKSMSGDYGPTIEDDEPYEKLREVGRARCTGQETQLRVGRLKRPIDSIVDPEMFRRPGSRVG
jgi:hypothetical protein